MFIVSGDGFSVIDFNVNLKQIFQYISICKFMNIHFGIENTVEERRKEKGIHFHPLEWSLSALSKIACNPRMLTKPGYILLNSPTNTGTFSTTKLYADLA